LDGLISVMRSLFMESMGWEGTLIRLGLYPAC
jgi:hypothetical protein